MPRLVCLDVDGTLTGGVMRPALPGAADAVRRIRARIPVRLVTNTTSRPHATLAEHLAGCGLLENPEHLITPSLVARRVLHGEQAAGTLLVEPEARTDFGWFREDPGGPTVLVATEAHDWRIADLQPAFRALLRGADLYALQQNRYFRLGEDLVTDLGPVAAFLAYASGREPVNLGKPSRTLFQMIAAGAGLALSDLVMVGDDAEFDVSGAMRHGLAGILVRTGKFRPGDESKFAPTPSAVLDSVADLPQWLGIP